MSRHVRSRSLLHTKHTPAGSSGFHRPSALDAPPAAMCKPKFRRRNKDVLAQVTRSDSEADTHPLPLRRPVNTLQSWGLLAASPLTPSATMCDIERSWLGFHRRLLSCFTRRPEGPQNRSGSSSLAKCHRSDQMCDSALSGIEWASWIFPA